MKIISLKRYFSGRVILLIICLFFAGIMATSSVQASSFIFKPNVVTLPVGRTFTLPVMIDPKGLKQYTARLFITFPPDRLEVISFAFEKDWLALPQALYDLLDNKRGELIKTAGFPKGFSSPVLFGTITLRAKGAGESVITVQSQSFVLNANNESSLESRPQVRIVAAKGLVPKTVSVAPLPDLPIGEKNIFDISLAPEREISRPRTMFFVIFFIIAVILGIIGQAVFARFRRRSLMKKIENDQYFKK